MNKKCILILIMLFFVTTPIISGVNIPIGTIDYLEDDLLYILGNVSLVYNDSETGTNDIMIIWGVYVESNDISIIAVDSTEITYDYTFVNDTKEYWFDDTNSGNIYIIYVNYSSIEVPEGIESALNKTIDLLEDQVLNLTSVITEMNNSLGLLEVELEGKNIIVENLYKEIGVALTERDIYKDLVDPLRYEMNLTKDDLSFYENLSEDLTLEVDQLEGRVDYYDSIVEVLMNPMTSFYNFNGVDNMIFNFPSIIIGIIITLVILYLIRDWIKKSREDDIGTGGKSRGMIGTLLYAIKFKIFGNRFRKRRENEPSIDETIDKHDEKELTDGDPENIPKPSENVPGTDKPTHPTQNHSDQEKVARTHEMYEIIDVMIA